MNRIKTAALTPVAFAIFCKEQLAAEKAAKQRRAEEKAYNTMIAESQAKIGDYKPITCPTVIWA